MMSGSAKASKNIFPEISKRGCLFSKIMVELPKSSSPKGLSDTQRKEV